MEQSKLLMFPASLAGLVQFVLPSGQRGRLYRYLDSRKLLMLYENSGSHEDNFNTRMLENGLSAKSYFSLHEPYDE